MMPTVRGVIAASIAAGSIVKVTPSVSQKITVAPACVIIAEVLIQECAVVMTSSPGFTFRPFSASQMASVPLAQETQCFTAAALANSRSNRSTCGPRMNEDSLMTEAIAASISLLMVRYCSCRSAKGTGMITSLLPTQAAHRVSGIAAGFGNVLRHHRARPYNHIIHDPHRQNGGVGTDRHAVADHGLAPELLAAARRPAGRESIVDEHHTMAYETAFADGDEFADEGMRLYPRARTDHSSPLNLGEGTDETIVADLALIEVAGLDHFHARAEFDVADACLMQFG